MEGFPGMRYAVWALWMVLITACTQPSALTEPVGVSAVRGAIPPRPAGAMTGSEFLRYIQSMTTEQRESAILREVRSGNIPDFLRSLRPVRVTASRGGRVVQGTIFVMPDYLAVGTPSDYAYVPMNPLTAQRIADQFALTLPTKKLVDVIYAAADVRLTPAPMPAGPAMVGTDYYRRHNESVLRQLGSRGGGRLVAGHKKDVVLTNRLCRMRRRVAIYGWHRGEGKPIQPLSLVHDDHYADYSHGIRLVANLMLVDGVLRPVADVLASSQDAALLSDEGPLRQVRIATDCDGC
jgi:hypothetical protein